MPVVRLKVAAALMGLVAAASMSHAQTVYRIVGPDGRVTFSDRPPAEAQGGKASAAPVMNLPGGGDASGGSLPFELRTIAARYPVTLYARPGCVPCDAGRNYLTTRGIPFTEKSVTTQEDVEALQRMSGAASLPFATIGGQQLKGYSESEWGQFLDAAGYPRTSQLPPNYRSPAPTPMVAVARPPAAAPAQPDAQAAAAAPAPAPAPVAPAGPSPANPAGIQF